MKNHRWFLDLTSNSRWYKNGPFQKGIHQLGFGFNKEQTFVSAIWKSKKMKLALLVIATLALVCLSWAMDADNEQKDVKLPGKIELKRIANFWMKTFTIACVYLSFYTCQNCSRWKKIDRFVDPKHLDADSRISDKNFQ